MSRFVIVLVALLGCMQEPTAWDGIPEKRTCSTPTSVGAATCLAEGKIYQCVRSGDRMLCSRDTVEIKCTNIVNVETVCPGKAP